MPVNYWHIVLKLLEADSVRVSQLSKQTGIPQSRISMWRSRGATPKYEDYLLLKDWVQKNRPDLAEPVIQVPVQKADIAALVIETSARVVAIQSAVAHLLALASAQPFEQVAKSLEAAAQAEVAELQQRFSQAG